MGSATQVPGPRGLPVLGNLHQFVMDPFGFMERLRPYGEVVKVRVGIDLYLLNHPRHIKHVLQDNHLNYRKGELYERLRPLLGDGLLLSEGEQWKRQRRLAQPAFHRERLNRFTASMIARTEALAGRWRAAGEGPRDIQAEMMRLTLEILGDSLFSMDLSGESAGVGHALHDAVRISIQRFFSLAPIPLGIPTPGNRRFLAARAELTGVVDRIIGQRRASAADPGDLLSMLMAARDEDTGERMPDGLLRDEVMTMLLAGHETTALSLAWTLSLLARHPEAAERIETERAAALGEADPGFGELPRLEFLQRVLQEGLRLYPPAYAFQRRAIADDELGGHRIPAGATLWLVPWNLHRDPAFWEAPERFDPDRFLPERSADRPKFAWFPFAAGPRQCIGMQMATVEAQLVLSMLCRRFRFEAQGPLPKPEASLTLRQSEGDWLRTVPRVASGATSTATA